MKRRIWPAVMFAVFALAGAGAMPVVQHLARGVVRTIDPESHVLVLRPGASGGALKFVLKDGFTQYSRNGKLVKMSLLTAGQPVYVYYRRKEGQCVAIMVWWNPEEVDPPGPSKAAEKSK